MKKMKKIVMLLCVCVVGMSLFSVSVSAESWVDMLVPMATGQFNVEVSGNSLYAASKTFPLEAKETVTIRAFYSPETANVDFGLVGPNGRFYYLSTSNGSFNRTIVVGERGNYAFAIKNNSSNTINVSGYVNY